MNYWMMFGLLSEIFVDASHTQQVKQAKKLGVRCLLLKKVIIVYDKESHCFTE